MITVFTGVKYKGQPVYRQYSDDKTRVYFFSREVKGLPDGTWKFIRWIPLKSVKLDLRHGVRKRLRVVELAAQEVLRLPGVWSE